jgi:hypothetical protein
MSLLVILGLLWILLLGVILYVLYVFHPHETTKKDFTPKHECQTILSSYPQHIEPTSFVPVEDRIVPTHASYSNKLNDSIGTLNAELAPGVKGIQEIVVPSDWYMSREPPSEYDGDYWPSGSIEPDFLYPGSDPNRPLRKPSLSAAYSQTVHYV